MSWPAPAKINLFLHIVGTRPDGYHLLQTAFQFIDYGDNLRFTVRQDGIIRRTTNIVDVPEELDLTIRAATLLRQTSGASLGVEISVEKRIPMGAGLGGGSSDAATTLVALNQLWSLNLPVDQLAELALRLGADVPVFVRGRAAWAEGIGEKLSPLELPELWYVFLVPPCHISTREIFAAPDLTRNVPPIKIGAFLSGAVCNVCEEVVRRRYPEVGEALDWLGTFASARMSGTGSAVFAAFKDEAAARRVQVQAPSEWWPFVARGLNLSPLLVASEAKSGKRN